MTNAGAGRVESLAPGSTLGYFSVVVSIILTLVTLQYVLRIDTDLTIAGVLFFGATIAAAVALWAVAQLRGTPPQRVGAAACGVSSGLLLVSRLAGQGGHGGFPGELPGWPVAGTIGAALLIGVAAVAVLTRAGEPRSRRWQVVAVAAAAAGVAVSAGVGLDRVPHTERVGDDAFDTQLGLNSNWWLVAVYTVLAVAACVRPARYASQRQPEPGA